jgi:isocitrate lyase
LQLRLVMQNRVQQRTVDFDVPVVADQDQAFGTLFMK